MSGPDEKIQSVKRNNTLTTHSSTSLSLNLSEDDEEEDEDRDDEDNNDDGFNRSETDVLSQKDKSSLEIVTFDAHSSLNLKFSDKNESSFDNIEQQVALLVENASRVL